MFKSNHTAGMIWFEGVVEDRVNDPLKLGRVRVRVFGQHTESLTDIPSDTLRWATVMMPTTSASMNGIGSTPFIVEGTHVIGFFRDGNSSQEAIIIGTIPGLNVEKPDTSKGFSDVRVDFSDSPEKASYNSDGSFSSIPAGAFPKDDFLDEPDTNRLARNEDTEESILKSKQATREKHTGVKGVDGSVIINEPSESYNAKYPYNKVLETESGHVIELDDTKGSERVMIAHRSGTYIELTPEGNAILKTVGDKYDLNSGDLFSHSANSTVVVDGTGTVHILGSADIQVQGKLDISSKGDMNIESGSSITMKAPKIDLNP